MITMDLAIQLISTETKGALIIESANFKHDDEKRLFQFKHFK